MAQKCIETGCKEDAESDSNYCAKHKPKLVAKLIQEGEEKWARDKK